MSDVKSDNVDLAPYVDKKFSARNLPTDARFELTIDDVVLEETGPQKDICPTLYFKEDPRKATCTGNNFKRCVQFFGGSKADNYRGGKNINTKDPVGTCLLYT